MEEEYGQLTSQFGSNSIDISHFEGKNFYGWVNSEGYKYYKIILPEK